MKTSSIELPAKNNKEDLTERMKSFKICYTVLNS